MSTEEKVIFKSGAASTEPKPLTRDEASEIAYRLVTRSEAQNTKILLVTDAIQGAYARGIADGLKRDTSLNASLGQEDQD